MNDFLHQLIGNARSGQLDHTPGTTIELAHASIQCFIVLTISAPDNAAASYRYDTMPPNPRSGNAPVHGQKFLPLRDLSIVSKSEGASHYIVHNHWSTLAAALRLGAALCLRNVRSAVCYCPFLRPLLRIARTSTAMTGLQYPSALYGLCRWDAPRESFGRRLMRL